MRVLPLVLGSLLGAQVTPTFPLSFLLLAYEILVCGNNLRSTHYKEFPYLSYVDYTIITGRFCMFCLQSNNTTNDSIFYMSDGMQGIYLKC